MSRQMLIDAAHPEETRVVVLDGSRVEEFDFESAARKQLRGNIYLAKVTRVEPSLQAAFIEYGGNRHGFLAFNEIHPDYYQIPHADREALMREAEGDGDEEDHSPPPAAPVLEGGEEDSEILVGGAEEEDEIDEDIARQRRRLMRRYKIQEVIKRRQIMLVQVVKEERGNKGAALTTYLSLAGRYCVLMPNTDRGGGISRKITAVADRKRLREVVAEFEVPRGMGLIVRTAGAKRTRPEIKRDYEYLSRAWGNIRDTTLNSIAPALIYEEEDLVKRAIRDLFDKDVEAIWVDGDEAFREARDFMRVLMPSQAKKVLAWRESTPLFMARKVEDHLGQIYSNTVSLKSGGYLVINQTEALVAVDVNSGRATRERNIEATALRTNLEAAEETARQLRLRDLAGLIVIDFIDMDEAKNNRAVEKVLKDCLARDRARIQMGRISAFGLMEISRQRRRTGILEGTTNLCPHCNGAGRVRSVESSALAALRAVEMEAVRGGGEVRLSAPKDVGLYILNRKRDHLLRLAHREGLFVSIALDDALGHADHQIERLSDTPYAPRPPSQIPTSPPVSELEFDDHVEEEDDDLEDETTPEESFATSTDEQTAPRAIDGDGDAGRRRRRRRRGRSDEPRRTEDHAPSAPVVHEPAAIETDAGGRRRRRGRRGGRGGRDETRTADVYSWAWPARLSGEDTYEWRGPVVTDPAPPDPAPSESAMQPATPALEAPAPSEQPPSPSETPDVWVELPATAERPARKSRARPRRGRAAPEIAEGGETAATSPDMAAMAEAVAPQPFAEPTELGETAMPSPEPAVEATPESAEHVVLPSPAEPISLVAEIPSSRRSEAPQAVTAEILTPAAAPRRGWWRRGA